MRGPLAAGVVPPLAAFVLARGVVWAASASVGLGVPGAADLSRHDSLLYLSIARHGFTIFACPRPGGWCGNSGWMPAYPLLVSPFSAAGLSAMTVAAIVSAVFQLATLVLLWNGFWHGRVTAKNVAALACAAVFPGAIYYAAVFPLSLLTFLFLLGLYLAGQRRVAAAVVYAAAAATYPVGILLGAAVGLRESIPRGTIRERGLRAAQAAGAGFAGLAAVSVVQRVTSGHWDSYVKVQRFYGHTGVDPLTTLRRAKAATLSFLQDPHRLDLVPSVQLLLTAAFVATVLVMALASRRRADLVPALLVGGAWLMPLALGGVALYRSDAALLPGLLVSRRLPPVAQVGFAVVAGLVAFQMDRLFFQSRLT